MKESKEKANKWPKISPPLTPEEKAISDEYVAHWLAFAPKKYALLEHFNHSYPAKQIKEDLITSGKFRTF